MADRDLTGCLAQLESPMSPTALSGTRPAAHEDVMEWTVGELIALLSIEPGDTALSSLAALNDAVAFARTVLARDARDGFAKESGR